MGRGVKIQWIGVEIPWVGGSKYHGQGGSTYHGLGVNIPWLGGQNTMARVIKIPCVKGVDIP
jgi:hypothetical protein